MKNLGKTIECLIKIEPNLESTLLGIKKKWEQHPNRTLHYWKTLLKVLNTEPWLNHSKRSDMWNVINKKRIMPKKRYTFEEVTSKDNILGVIPENISDLIKKLDRQLIDIAKLQLEATMTHDADLAALGARKQAIHTAQTKKMWVSLKDHFKLWDTNMNFSIKIKNGFLVLIELIVQEAPQFVGPGIVKMDSATLQKFINFLESDQKPPLE